ncbi:MAG: enoyl-CoA hydratase-related protein [Dehalococcoidales bacterium]|nr:enoyl-CoA hydratase-related protein [Dehalococcoidales bacterium]
MPIDYQVEGKIATFTINRPEAFNAANVQILEQLHEYMIAFRDNPDVWVGIVTGAGEKAFCAGADIAETLPFMKSIRGKPWLFPDSPLRFLDLYKPLIAAVNGVALGGGLEIMLTCDIRIAAEHARFGSPEVNLGLIPGWGGTQRLLRTIPYVKAAEIILSGKPINAPEAYRIGLINEVVKKEELMPRARQWAADLCRVGPLALRAAKEAMMRGYNLPLSEGLKLESELFDYLLGTEDHAEGRNAFLQKSRPEFKGK